MVHGDLKGVCFRRLVAPFILPSSTAKANILIDRTGHARIADFGLLTTVSDPTNILPSSSYAQGGTARWMSPELINPQQFGFEKSRPTISSDCYALGMVTYETISGCLPFHEHTDLTVIVMVLGGARPPRGAGFTDSLWEILELCWVPQPDARPKVKDVLQHLESFSSSSGMFSYLTTPTMFRVLNISCSPAIFYPRTPPVHDTSQHVPNRLGLNAAITSDLPNQDALKYNTVQPTPIVKERGRLVAQPMDHIPRGGHLAPIKLSDVRKPSVSHTDPSGVIEDYSNTHRRSLQPSPGSRQWLVESPVSVVSRQMYLFDMLIDRAP